MVGMVGLAPTETVRPGVLQTPAIAAMRHAQIGAPTMNRTWIDRSSGDCTSIVL